MMAGVGARCLPNSARNVDTFFCLNKLLIDLTFLNDGLWVSIILNTGLYFGMLQHERDKRITGIGELVGV